MFLSHLGLFFFETIVVGPTSSRAEDAARRTTTRSSAPAHSRGERRRGADVGGATGRARRVSRAIAAATRALRDLFRNGKATLVEVDDGENASRRPAKNLGIPGQIRRLGIGAKL